MELQAKARGERPCPTVGSGRLGLYCHVPFCASTCDFCAFYQEKPRREDLDAYLKGMEIEFSRLPQDRAVATVFWGGGTPGLLPAKDLERLGSAMLDAIGGPPEEWTVEMAPSTVKADKLRVLRALGVTRISMGVQSFDARLLESLGRLHRPGQIYKAWEQIEAADFPQRNLDLMFALPGQTIDAWERDLETAARLDPGHLSTYCLTLEEDTALYLRMSEGRLRPDAERELAFYERGWERLEGLGMRQYEISNFGRDGHECLHNMDTWTMQEWIGCGPSAASQYAGERYQRPAHLKGWLEALAGGAAAKEGLVRLDATTLLVDAVVFGLRMNRGICLPTLAERFPGATALPRIERLLERLCSEGLAGGAAGRYHLTHAGRLVCDAVGAELL